MKFVLRKDQEEFFSHEINECIRKGNKRIMIQAPTGYGKTVLAARFVDGALNKGKRVMFVAPTISLIDQTARRFHEEGFPWIGIIQSNHPAYDPAAPLQVASIQTLERRKNIPHADVVIIDEAHSWRQFYAKWFDAWNKVFFIGLSASPWTKGLGKYYQKLLIADTTAGGIAKGYLTPFTVYAPTKPDLSNVKTIAGDYAEHDLEKIMDVPTITADVIKSWKELGENRPTLCFAVNRAHAKHLEEQFNQANISTGYIDAYTDLDERREIEKKFHSGEVQIVCNVGCLTTGIDWDVRCIILARPTKSEMLFVQIIGRGLRLAKGKEDCLILDHSDTHQRLGFVTDIHYDELDDGSTNRNSKKKQEEKLLPKICPKCKFLKPPKTPICPKCQFKPEPVNGVTVADGKLERLSSKSGKFEDPHYRHEFFRMLKFYAAYKAYKPGWAMHAYKEKFKTYPPNEFKHSAELMPNSEVDRFIKYLNIKRAKARRAA